MKFHRPVDGDSGVSALLLEPATGSADDDCAGSTLSLMACRNHRCQEREIRVTKQYKTSMTCNLTQLTVETYEGSASMRGT